MRQKIGAEVKRLRLAAGKTQEDLAEYANLHVNQISFIERAQVGVTVDALNRVCTALDTPLSKFFAAIEE
ncbi:MAG TPA: helix-turn-helix transcriptional regulator [Capsulimonadaceae bacterium]